MAWVGGARVNANKKAVLTLYTGKIFNYRSNQLAMQKDAQGWRLAAVVSTLEQIDGNGGGEQVGLIYS